MVSMVSRLCCGFAAQRMDKALERERKALREIRMR